MTTIAWTCLKLIVGEGWLECHLQLSWGFASISTAVDEMEPVAALAELQELTTGNYLVWCGPDFCGLDSVNKKHLRFIESVSINTMQTFQIWLWNQPWPQGASCPPLNPEGITDQTELVCPGPTIWPGGRNCDLLFRWTEKFNLAYVACCSAAPLAPPSQCQQTANIFSIIKYWIFFSRNLRHLLGQRSKDKDQKQQQHQQDMAVLAIQLSSVAQIHPQTAEVVFGTTITTPPIFSSISSSRFSLASFNSGFSSSFSSSIYQEKTLHL